MELELADICLRMKKESNNRRDCSPTRASQYKPKRGGSLSRQIESHGLLEKGLRLERSMKKYKHDLLKRDVTILELVKLVTERELSKALDSSNSKRVNRELFASELLNDRTIALTNKLKEVQKLNGSLLDELKNTHAKLMDARLQKEKILANTNMELKIPRLSSLKSWKSPLSKTVNYSKERSTDINWSSEKIEMQSKMNKLKQSLDTSNESIIKVKTEYIKQLNSYYLKFSEISNCLGDFLSALENLPMDTQDKEFQESFEQSKAKLISLYRDIQEFDNRDLNVKSNYKKHEAESPELNIVNSPINDQAKLSVSKSQGLDNINSLEKYKCLIDKYKLSEQTMKNKIAELNKMIKKQDKDVMNIRKNEAIMLNVITKLKIIDTKMSTGLTKMVYKVNIQLKRMEGLAVTIKQSQLKSGHETALFDQLRKDKNDMNIKLENLGKEILDKDRSIQEMRKVVNKLNLQLGSSQSQYKKSLEANKGLMNQVRLEQNEKVSLKIKNENIKKQVVNMTQKIASGFSEMLSGIRKNQVKLLTTQYRRITTLISTAETLKQNLHHKADFKLQIEKLSKKANADKDSYAKSLISVFKGKVINMISGFMMKSQAKMTTQKDTVNSLKNTVEVIHRKFSKIKQQNAKHLKEIQVKLLNYEELIKNLKENLVEVHEKSRVKSSNNDKLIGKLKEFSKAISKRIKDFEENVDNHTKNNNDKSKELFQTLIDLNKSERENSKLIIIDTKLKLNEVESRIEKLLMNTKNGLSNAINNFQAVIQQQKNNVDSCKKSFSRKLIILDEKNKKNNDQIIKTFQEQIKEKDKELKKLSKQLATKNEQINNLSTAIGGDEKQKETIDMLQKELKVKKELHKKQVSELESLINKKACDEDSIKGNITEFAKKYDQQLNDIQSNVTAQEKDYNKILKNISHKLTRMCIKSKETSSEDVGKVEISDAKVLIVQFCQDLIEVMATHAKGTDEKLLMCNDTLNLLTEKIGMFVETAGESEQNMNGQITTLETELEKAKRIVKTDEEYYEKLLKENDASARTVKIKLKTFISTMGDLQKNFVSNIEMKIKYKMFKFEAASKKLSSLCSKINESVPKDKDKTEMKASTSSGSNKKILVSTLKKLRNKFMDTKLEIQNLMAEVKSSQNNSSEIVEFYKESIGQAIQAAVFQYEDLIDKYEMQMTINKAPNDEVGLSQDKQELIRQFTEIIENLKNENFVLTQQLESMQEMNTKSSKGLSEPNKGKVDELEKRLINVMNKLNELKQDLITEKEKSAKQLQFIKHINTYVDKNIEEVKENCTNRINKIEEVIASITQKLLSCPLSNERTGEIMEILDYFKEDALSSIEMKCKSISVALNSQMDQFTYFYNRLLAKAKKLTTSGLRISETHQSPLKKLSVDSHSDLEEENKRLRKEIEEQKIAINELTEKIIIMQSNVEITEEIKSNPENSKEKELSPMMELSKNLVENDAYEMYTPQKISKANANDSANSVHTCPVMTQSMKNKSKEQMEAKVADHIKMLAIQCLSKVPLNLVKDFDSMLLPLCSMMGMTPEEQRQLYQKRRQAKAEIGSQKKGTGGFLSMFS